MSMLSSKLRSTSNPATGAKGLIYWCQGCGAPHAIRTSGPSPVWSWNGDAEKPVFSPSVLVTYTPGDGAEREPDDPPARCHTFVGCNGAKPGEVIFLDDCTHALAGTVQPFPDLPEYLKS